jgi:hypothetical protein
VGLQISSSSSLTALIFVFFSYCFLSPSLLSLSFQDYSFNDEQVKKCVYSAAEAMVKEIAESKKDQEQAILDQVKETIKNMDFKLDTI